MKKTASKLASIKKLFNKCDIWFGKYAWWQICLWFFGGVTIISLLVILFVPVGNGPSSFTYSSPLPGVNTPQFTNMLSKSLVLPLEKGDDIQLLNNGDEFMPALLKDIDSAKRSINFMVYIWKDGKMSDQVLDHLSRKVKQKVQVRIMLDDFGSNGKPDDKLDEFIKIGGRVETFHSLTLVPWNLSNNHTRNHRRAIVIDGIIGYTGGIAVKDYWLGHAQSEDNWRDMMFRTTGSMVGFIQGTFAELWATNCGEVLTGNLFFPQAAANPDTSTLSYIALSSTPSANSLQLQRFLMITLMAAQKKLYITSPYFLPDRSFTEALMNKARAGVDVRVLVPNELSDASGVRYASHYTYQELLDAGVKIYEYQPTFIHSKLIVIDNSWTVIGSANMDNRSRKINEESVFGIADTKFGNKMDSVFMQDLKHAKLFNAKEWAQRSYLERVREIFARKFVQQY